VVERADATRGAKEGAVQVKVPAAAISLRAAMPSGFDDGRSKRRIVLAHSTMFRSPVAAADSLWVAECGQSLLFGRFMLQRIPA